MMMVEAVDKFICAAVPWCHVSREELGQRSDCVWILPAYRRIVERHVMKNCLQWWHTL
jgi:hypothetical protein